MAEEDIIQNMIFRLGQSQKERMPKELGVHFADVDERTPEDLLFFAKRFAEFVKYYRYEKNPDGSWKSVQDGNWEKFFAYDEAGIKRLLEGEGASTPPHLALFIAFLELYKKPQEIINRITGRHLDFYYKEVLRLTKKPAAPDKAHVLVELKKHASPITITPHKDFFSAGKDQTGVELIYDPTSETVINTSKVDSLRSLFVDQAGHGTVHYAPIANSCDGLGGKLPEDEPKWRGFGHSGLPHAEVGFAVASPVLRMREGTRKVIVTLTLENVDPAKLTDTALAGAFEAFITGEKNWLGPYSVSPRLRNGNRCQFEFQIPETEKAVVDYDASIHGYFYTARAPIVQVLLKADVAAVGYKDFDQVILQKAAVSVEVSDVTSLQLESDAGVLDPKKAFLPFGPQPVKGSRFMVGYGEALAKKLSEVAITVEWKDAPSNLSTHYAGYGVAAVNNNYFTASVAFSDGGSWEYNAIGQKLFQSANAATEITYIFPPPNSSVPASVSPGITTGMRVYALSAAGSRWASAAVSRFLLEKPVFLAFKTAALEAKQGFITFSLEKDFLHATYRKKYVENVMIYSRSGGTLTILNEPYTPAIRSIFLSYKAYSDDVSVDSGSLSDFANGDVQFFHIAYFGQMREHRYQREQFDFLADKRVPLLPRYAHEGELLIGLSDLSPGDSVSVLFQVAEGSANPDLEQQDIGWFVLCDNYWRPLGSGEVVLDTTNQLLTSGIIKFVIPSEATTDNSILPADRIWLKAGIATNVTAVCQLIEVAANAVEVQFTDRGNDPGHLLQSLEHGKISKLKNPISAVKSVKQPYASFAGAPLEADDASYARIAERLRHKNRCISAWDYERIVLEAFPKVHKVKCIPHAREGSWLAPGYVTIVVIPDLRNKNAVDPLQPKVDAGTLSRIASYIRARTGMQVKVSVKNPSYQKIQVDFKVKFRPGFEFNYYSEALKQELVRFLCPWAFDAGRDLAFGGKVYKSVLLDFVEELNYVDYVTDFKMYSYVGEANNYSDLNEAQPATPDAILVSEKTHIVERAA